MQFHNATAISFNRFILICLYLRTQFILFLIFVFRKKMLFLLFHTIPRFTPPPHIVIHNTKELWSISNFYLRMQFRRTNHTCWSPPGRTGAPPPPRRTPATSGSCCAGTPAPPPPPRPTSQPWTRRCRRSRWPRPLWGTSPGDRTGRTWTPSAGRSAQCHRTRSRRRTPRWRRSAGSWWFCLEPPPVWFLGPKFRKSFNA